MRIISGNHKGKQIKAPDSLPVRPTTDMAKEALFNILNNYFYFDAIEVLDLFAGTGNISYEFAAREALNVVSVDIDHRCTDFIAKTAKTLNFQQVHTINMDAFAFLSSHKKTYNVIFADPPYAMENTVRLADLVFERKLLNEGGMLVIEHPKSVDFSQHHNFLEQRNYGKVNFSFFVYCEADLKE